MNLLEKIYKKTLSYELDKVTFDENGNPKHYHSDKFLDEHPERRSNPEFTEEEELEVYKFIAEMAKRF